MSKFVYLNVNPDSQRKSDCVTRAISLASGLPYAKVRKKLFHISKLLECEKLCMSCYKHLIEDVLNYRRVNCQDMTVGDFADLNPSGVYLVRVDGHISTIIDNVCYDIWDCRDQFVTDAWKIE